MQTIKPAPKQLFCKPEEAVTKTASGILLDQKAAEKPRTAEVINVGDKVTAFSPHDKIVYKPYSTTDIKLNGEDFFLVPEDDVLGVGQEVKR